nr:type IV pilus secretin PilQ [Paraburkholderia hayleyella]
MLYLCSAGYVVQVEVHAAVPPLPPLPSSSFPRVTAVVAVSNPFQEPVAAADPAPTETDTDINTVLPEVPEVPEVPDAPEPGLPAGMPPSLRSVPQAVRPNMDTRPAVEGLEGPPVPLPAAARLSPATSATPGYSPDDGLGPDKPITLDFQHAELGAVLNAFARFTGLNIVASERVRGAVSLQLDKVPWREAFDTLLDVNGLAMKRRGKVIWVAPVADLAARERLRYEAHARAMDLEPLASRTFELHYARAEEVRRLLTASGSQRVLSKRGAVMADPRTNMLFVTDLQVRLAQIGTLLSALDRPARQVLIEARIVEGEQGFSRTLGARLSLASTRTDGVSTGLAGGKEGSIYDLSARPIAGFEAATAGLTLFAAHATRLLNIELSALEAEGRGQLVSSPRVVTAERMKAIVEQGTELPYQAKVGQGVSGVQFRRASLKLEVEPQITPDGRVVLDLDVAKDSVGEQTAAGPAINTKHVRTRVEVEDGGTVSIGGIYETANRDDVARVPFLGKIPFLGALFRHRAHRDQRSELVVFITPKVVQPD